MRCLPSVPTRIGVSTAICGGCSSRSCRVRPAHDVEGLVGAAELNVGLQRDRVVALHQSIHELVHVDRLLRVDPVRLNVSRAGELLHGEVRGQVDDVAERHLAEPLAVAADLGADGIEQLEGLILVGLGVAVEDLGRLHRAQRVLVRRVADQSGEVADQQDRLVSELLEQGQLAQRDAVADVQVGRGRVNPEIDAQGTVFDQRLGQARAKLAVHRAARAFVAVGGTAHDQRVLTLDFCRNLCRDSISHGFVPIDMPARRSRAASRSLPICLTNASTPSNLRSPRRRSTNSTRKSVP